MIKADRVFAIIIAIVLFIFWYFIDVIVFAMAFASFWYFSAVSIFSLTSGCLVVGIPVSAISGMLLYFMINFNEIWGT